MHYLNKIYYTFTAERKDRGEDFWILLVFKSIEEKKIGHRQKHRLGIRIKDEFSSLVEPAFTKIDSY